MEQRSSLGHQRSLIEKLAINRHWFCGMPFDPCDNFLVAQQGENTSSIAIQDGMGSGQEQAHHSTLSTRLGVSLNHGLEIYLVVVGSGVEQAKLALRLECPFQVCLDGLGVKLEPRLGSSVKEPARFSSMKALVLVVALLGNDEGRSDRVHGME